MAKDWKGGILGGKESLFMEKFEQAKKEIERLSRELVKHQDLYYKEAQPLISDLEYDRLVDQLIALEERYPELRAVDSPSQRVGSDLNSEFPEVPHTVMMLSLDKTYSPEGILEWIEKSNKRVGHPLTYIVEEKIDGVSLVLYYEEGLLARAVTRGNGVVGNDITPNAKTIGTIPLRLTQPLDIAVRGEVFLPLEQFESLNRNLETPFANPRNLAAGTLRRLKSSETAKIPLRMFAYELFFTNPAEGPQSHLESLRLLKELGFYVNESYGLFAAQEEEALRLVQDTLESGSYEAITNYVKVHVERRESLSYEIDGLVVKVNELAEREVMGYTGHHPRWAIAYKFEAPEAETVVEGIDVQVGRTGRITPVARVKAVRVGNSVVSNVTLHNQDYINLLELALHDRVSISKRGDVIPAVERVLEKNEEGYKTWQMPQECPSCNTPLVERGAHTFCPNTECPAQVKGRIVFFAGRNQMDIEGFGPETINFLFDKGFIQDIPDLYAFNYLELIGEEGFGEKKSSALAKAIEESKKRPFRSVLVALGIADFGKKGVDLLVDSGIKTVQTLFKLIDSGNRDYFLAIKGLGEKSVDNLFDHLLNKEFRGRILALIEAGLTFEEVESGEEYEPLFAGEVWSVTGSFEVFNPRSLALKEIEKRGGRTTGSVSGKTTHLLAGKGAGSKLKQAQDLGVTVVDEEQFLKLLEGE